MSTIYVIVENTVVVENGKATTVKVVLPDYGYYMFSVMVASEADAINRAWALEKSLCPSSYHKPEEDYLTDFFTLYGVEPYDYVSININTFVETHA